MILSDLTVFTSISISKEKTLPTTNGAKSESGTHQISDIYKPKCIINNTIQTEK